MDKLFDEYDKVISLGYNCYMKLFLKYKKIDQETNFFDYIGTSLWSIIDMFDNNFEGVFDEKEYKIMRIMEKGPDMFLVVNEKYFIRCKHEFKKTLETNFKGINMSTIDTEEITNFLSKMNRRKDRFIDLLKNDDSILFLRYEEDPVGRCRLKQYDEKIKLSSEGLTSNLKKISGIFKQFNNKKKFLIIDLSYRHNKTEYFNEHNLIKIKMKERIHRWECAHTEIDSALNNEKEFLSRF